MMLSLGGTTRPLGLTQISKAYAIWMPNQSASRQDITTQVDKQISQQSERTEGSGVEYGDSRREIVWGKLPLKPSPKLLTPPTTGLISLTHSHFHNLF